jgi:hypothetical protein
METSLGRDQSIRIYIWDEKKKRGEDGLDYRDKLSSAVVTALTGHICLSILIGPARGQIMRK